MLFVDKQFCNMKEDIALSQDLFFNFLMKLFTSLIVQIKGTITYFWPKIMNVIEIQVIIKKGHSAIWRYDIVSRF
jgi:hypothetical protein